MPQVSPQILRKATAKSVILGRKNQKKVLWNPGGTDIPFSIHSAFQNMQASHTECTYAAHTIRDAGFWTERW